MVAEIGGHGIGRARREPPFVSDVGRVVRDLVLREGMTFTIEPMVNPGGPRVRTLADGWTVVTADGAWSAQFEHTVLVLARGGRGAYAGSRGLKGTDEGTSGA